MPIDSDSGDRRGRRAVAESASEVAMKLLAMLGLGPSLNGRNGPAAEGAGGASGTGAAKTLDTRTQRQVRRLIDACRNLLGERGESSGMRLAAEALELYREASTEGRKVFYDTLGTEFSPDPAEAAQAGVAYQDDPTAAQLPSGVAMTHDGGYLSGWLGAGRGLFLQSGWRPVLETHTQ